MKQQASVMVYIEQRNGNVADVSIELICEANRLAQQLDAAVEGIAVGAGAGESLAYLGGYGCPRILFVKDPRLARYTSLPYAKAVESAIERRRPRIVLFGATKIGRDLAPRVASALKCGLTADCTGLEIGGHQAKGKRYENLLLQIRPAFGGNILATIISPDSQPSMATVREGVMKENPPDASLTAEIVDMPVPFDGDDFLTEILEVVEEEKSVDLRSARIIVSAGMGASQPESIAMIRELARLLGGEVGASRPVVDAGLLGKAHQVGQTGTSVRPNLYIACGISGQIQHRAGIAGAKRIVAINENPEAPIFNIAHYGIVGDVNDILPNMIKACKTRQVL